MRAPNSSSSSTLPLFTYLRINGHIAHQHQFTGQPQASRRRSRQPRMIGLTGSDGDHRVGALCFNASPIRNSSLRSLFPPPPSPEIVALHEDVDTGKHGAQSRQMLDGCDAVHERRAHGRSGRGCKCRRKCSHTGESSEVGCIPHDRSADCSGDPCCFDTLPPTPVRTFGASLLHASIVPN